MIRVHRREEDRPVKLNEEMEKALNAQVTMELASAASYLQMAAYFSHQTWTG